MTPNSPNKVLKAVALKYELNGTAPRVTGQGEGFVADAILARAKEFGIPTKTEPELVEFLMQLKLNELVPPKLYAAVAEVLAWAYELKQATAADDLPLPEIGVLPDLEPGAKTSAN